MKSKIKKLKYPKNPAALLDREDVLNYIYNLEDRGELDNLSLPILVYYVVGVTLTNEVNNGGFAQYLSNSSVATLPYLERCVKAIDNAELTAIITELFESISKHLGTYDIQTIKDTDYSEELEVLLSALDDRFYDLDDKQDVLGLTEEYYQANIPEEKLVIEIVKERESETIRYFVADVKSVTNEEAAESFMEFLSEFTGINFEIIIRKYGEFFRITAIDDTNSLDLRKIMAHFHDEKYSFGENGGVHNRYKMLGFKFGGGIFKEINIDACDERKDLWRISITESGFEKNEYKMSLCRIASFNPASQYTPKIISHITAGDMSYKAVNLESIEDFLIRCAKKQANIKRIVEEERTESIINVIYES